MNKQKEALRLALEALEHEAEIGNDDAYRTERYAIREALAEQDDPGLQDKDPELVEQHYKQVVDDVRKVFDAKRETLPAQDQGQSCYCPNCEALSKELAALKAQQQEPVAWMPIEQMYPQGKAIDILMGDGSILCAVLPQFDGDLWWEGSGTGEKFIDPKYANVTHWRVHDEHTSPQPAQPSKPWVGLTDEERDAILDREFKQWWSRHDAVCRAIEAKLREKNA